MNQHAKYTLVYRNTLNNDDILIQYLNILFRYACIAYVSTNIIIYEYHGEYEREVNRYVHETGKHDF